MLRLRAAHVYPITAPPIADGAVLVGDDGRIAWVGPHAQVPVPPQAEVLEFPGGSLTPGLVNCHTHLELTHLAGMNQAREFPLWLRRVRELKDQTPPAEFHDAAERGIRDCWARGVTCIAETGSTGAVIEALARLGGRGIVYHEVFGPDPAQCDRSMAELDAALRRFSPLTSATVRLGVSPHAPFTVSAPLYQAVVACARRENLPLAVHIAESPDESRYVQEGAGPFATALADRGMAVTARGCSPIAWLAQLGVLAPDTLCIHCVQASVADVAVLARAGAAVAHCPRSNRAHAHGAAPLAALQAAGVRVGLGTDSVVSVPDLDLWAEATAAGLGAKAGLHAMTLDGAAALDWAGEIGSLAAGKAADLAVFATPRLPAPSPRALLTLVAGRVVHRADA